MRILHLRFKNLNSLVGEWEIDFSHPAFVADGIFAITGPTGAGKTTILDAICLALYGRTPRLNKVTKSGNEIMSRQTGECFAEVTFETQAGRYRCHWSQHRARKKPDGELQNSKHEIVDAETGKIFETKLRGVAELIESATGMDFDRFTRSMLLAQGGFAAFLQASPDDRAPILEQITGTEIYSQISIRVHELQRGEREKLNLLQAETTGILILEPEQEKEIAQALEAKQKEEAGLAAKFADISKAIAWRNAVDGLGREIISLSDEEKKLQSDFDEFKSERGKLDRAMKAALLDSLHTKLGEIRKQQLSDRESLKKEEKTIPGLESSNSDQAESMKLVEQQIVKAKEELKTAMPIWQTVRLLDQRIIQLKKAAAEAEGDCISGSAQINASHQVRTKEMENRSKATGLLANVDGYIKDHAEDEWLISGLGGVEEQLGSLLSRQKEIAQKEEEQNTTVAALERAMKSHLAWQGKCEQQKKELNGVVETLKQARESLALVLGDRSLREYRLEKESLLRETIYLAKIAELEDHRIKLEDGKPCPLCGATEHPFATGNLPHADEIEDKIEILGKLIAKAEEQEASIKKLEESENSARTILVESEKKELAAANDKKAAEVTRV
ncbi:MAG: AAA family ATPase, partial [bacterium]|nr:AAA family ATPase [bacterium]